MKMFRFIYMAVAVVLLMASCDDMNEDTDKARISGIYNRGELWVDNNAENYYLIWVQPEILTQNGYQAVSNSLSYNVFVATDYSRESLKFVKTVNGSETEVSYSEVATALGTQSGAQEFVFGVCLSGIDVADIPICYSSMQKQRGGDISVTGYANNSQGKVLGSGSYNYGEMVTLVAIPNDGYHFTMWSDGSTENPRRFQVTNDIRVLANFEEEVINYSIAATIKGGGKVTGAGNYFEYGQTVELTAIPDEGYVFCGWSDGNTENPRKLFVDGNIELVAYFESGSLIDKGYPGTNTWFVDGQNAIVGYVDEEGELVINVGGLGNVWDDNLEVVLQGLENQVAGNEFRMEFDIMWEGDKETAGFRICSGVDNYIPDIPQIDETFVPLSADEVWSPEFNTELIFDDFSEEMGKAFTVGSDWQHIEWGGTIGERGEKYIGIEINLAGFVDEGDQNVLNGAGTFRIKNMRINDEQVW